MGAALDTLLGEVTNQTSLTALTMASGDSLSVRSYADTSEARLLAVVAQGATTPQVRIISPRLHDNVDGLTFQAVDTPSVYMLPPEIGQRLYSVDTLVVQATSGAANSSAVALLNYYKNIQGIDADLRSWADIKPHIINMKIMEVAVTSSATIGAWTDTVITTTENQLKADYVYAVLGFMGSAALAVVGLKGPCTGNLRACAPGAGTTTLLTDYFIWMGERHGIPMIPCFKSNDRANTYISCAASTASASANVGVVLAQLPK